METNSRSEWVAGRLAAAKPEWQPNAEWARTRLQAMREGRRARRGWAAPALAAAAVLALFAVLPQGRVLAQEVLFRWFVRSFEVVRLDLSRVPLKTSVTMQGGWTGVSLEEAERLAGYRPILPSGEVMGGGPEKIEVSGTFGIQQRIPVKEFREALAAAGAGDVQVPAEWEGVAFRIDIAPIVVAGYSGEIQVAQTKPIELQAPAGFPLARLAEVVFRCAGIPAGTARAMGEKYAANPAWLLDIAEDEVVHVEEIRLGLGSGLLIEDPAEEGGGRYTILFSRSERVFAVIGSSRQECMRVANLLL